MGKEKGGVVQLYPYRISSTGTIIARLSSSVYVSAGTQIGNLDDYVTLDNFKLLYSHKGDTPILTLKYRSDGLIEAYLTGSNTYLYEFTLNDIVVYMLFGSINNVKDVLDEYGVSLSHALDTVPVFVVK